MNARNAGTSSILYRSRWLIIVACLTVSGMIGAFAHQLKIDGSYRVYFGNDNPERQLFEEIEGKYTKNDNVLIVVVAKHADIFSRSALTAIKELTTAAWQVPYATRVDSISNFQYTEAQGDDFIVRDLVEDAATLADAGISQVRKLALAEPVLRNRLVAADGGAAGVNIRVHLPGIDETRENAEVIDSARREAAKLEARYPSLSTAITGDVAMAHAFAEVSIDDIRTLVPLSIVLMMALLSFLLGSVGGALLVLAVVLMSIATAMGAAGYLGYPVSPPLATAPTIVLTVAIANCVHVLVSFFHATATVEGNRNAAIWHSVSANWRPVLLASSTTAIGFFSLNFSDVPPFRHLGTTVAIGVLASCVLSLTFVPTLLSYVRIRRLRQRCETRHAFTRLSRFVIRQRRRLMWATCIVCVATLVNIPRNELNDVFVEYFDESIQFRSDTDLTVEKLSGVYTIQYSLESEESGGISNPQFQSEADKFAKWYRRQPGVRHVSIYTDVAKRLNRNMHGDQQGMYKLPTHRELAAQYLLLYEMSLPYGLDVNDQINVDKSSLRMTVAIDTLPSKAVLELNAKAAMWLRENVTQFTCRGGTGPTVMFANIGQRNIRSMLTGTVTALVLISLILGLAFRSLKFGLISLLPNLVPAAVAFGLWGLFVGQVGLALSVVMSMTLGIVVDDTVHFLSRYLSARRQEGLDSRSAIRATFESVGGALLTTSVVLVVGFGVLAVSSFEPNAGMGLLTATVITIAIVADFLFLPPLLLALDRSRSVVRIPRGRPATRTAG